MKNEWTIEEFKATTIEENISKKIFTVPIYQRGLVWTERQKFYLVDTIKKGLPFGTLLLYKTDKNTYQIIDGLQRSNAILEFVKNPTQFFDDNDIDSDAIKEIVRLIGASGNKSNQEEIVKNLLINWVKEEHKTLSDVISMQFSKFGKIISNQFATCIGKEIEIGDLIEPMMKNYQDICSTINNTKIPAIVMSGDEEMLPILFERINSKGTQLTKYQIYAATWNSTKYKMNDSHFNIVKANNDRYNQMFDSEGQIEDYDSSKFLNEMSLNAFEIAFGLGKYLSKTYPHLFGESKDDTKVESIGFTLLGTCLGVKYTDAHKLHTELEEKIGQDNINSFLSKILESVNTVDRRIGKFSKFKSNSRVSGKKPLHSEMQIAAIIASVFLMKWATIEHDDKDNVKSITYDFRQVSKKWKKEYENNFASNISKRYLSEIFRKKWIGTGNAKLDQILSIPNFYAMPVTKEEFKSTMDSWFNAMNEERAELTRIAAPKEPELVFLSAVYQTLFTAADHCDGSNYDIEHIATQKLMKDHLLRFDGHLRLPLSSIGNLCLLPEYTNRSKKDKTLYDDEYYLSKSKITLEELENKFSFTKKEDLEWIYDTNSSMEEFKANYMNFIENHFKKMEDILLENYDKL